MYNQQEGESKYHVANILSSMANGEPTISVQVNAYATPSVPFTSGMAMTTSSLTPTSLNNFEQTFIELQSVPTATTAHNPVPRSGFVPPVVSSATGHHTEYDSDSSSSNDDYLPTAPKKIRIGDKTTTIMSKYEIENPQRKTHRRHLKDEEVSPEEAARRNLRRERNKVAAAKCRQRRVDHTNRLLNETEKLEQEQASIEQEIQSLQQEKDQLEFILQAHSPLCKSRNPTLKIKTEPGLTVPECSTKSQVSLAESSKKRPVVSTARPSTLPLINGNLKNQLTSAGISITTPSSGFYSFSLDTMVDHTGLTPLTGSLGHTGLTPITSMPSTCSSEATKKSSTSSENSDSVKSPAAASNLISL
jgi:fos-like antigen